MSLSVRLCHVLLLIFCSSSYREIENQYRLAEAVEPEEDEDDPQEGPSTTRH